MLKIKNLTVFRCTALFLPFIILMGCSPAAIVIPVEGTVTIGGKPAEGISVTFMPDVVRGNTGPTSYGSSDADGKFTLTTSEGTLGAVPGPHLVTLVDEQEERPLQGETQSKPARLSSQYAMPQNGLKVDVAEGTPIELAVPAN